ncbi:MAG: AMP-binding protein [bacterium]|nr:AMP-binding protein [bacterium]
MLSALAALLSRCTGKDELVLGSATQSDQPRKVFPLRLDLSGNPRFRDIMEQVSTALELGEPHREITFNQLIESIEPDRNIKTEPLFQVLFGLYTQSIAVETIEERHAGSDLGLFFKDNGETLEITLTYNSNLFESSTITKFAHRLQSLLQGIVTNPDETLSKLPFMMDDDEMWKLLHQWNETKSSYPSEKRMDELFEYHAEKNPDADAVIFGDSRMTYRELNEKANQLAHYLRKKGVGPNSVVPILEERTPQMLTAMMAVMKAGGAYLPIDMKNPIERILMMLDDSGSKLFLSRDHVLKENNIPYSRLLNLHDVTPQLVKTAPRPQITELDKLPFPDRTLVNYKKYNQYIGAGCSMKRINLLATRGCPYKCAYCHTLWPKTHFIRSAQNIYDEISRHYDRGYESFSFADDIFNMNRANSEEFFRLIVKSDMKIRLLFPSGMRADVLKPDYIDLMSEAGVTQMALALESASPRIQKLIQKFVRLEKFKEMLSYLCSRHPHIILDLFTMHGFPSETEEEALMTMSVIKETQWIHFPYIFNLKVYPNTAMAQLAMDFGITRDTIEKSSHGAYHTISDITPFSKAFSREYQTGFMKDYFLLPERLEAVIPQQKKVFTREEMIARYNIYLPGGLKAYPDVEQLIGTEGFYHVDRIPVEEREPEVAEKAAKPVSISVSTTPDSLIATETPLKILLVDLSQNYTHDKDTLHEIVEAPLGLMYLQTVLNEAYGDKIEGKIIKSMIDFDSHLELKAIIQEFKPDMIGTRTLSFYKPFFHKTVALMKTWAPEVPIITGGPYAASEYDTLLSDRNIDLVCLGEGEETITQLVGKILENNGKFPSEEVLKDIPALIFLPRASKPAEIVREAVLTDRLNHEIDAQGKENPPRPGTSEDLAYVIFTSGSTGKPKGAMITHANALAFLYGFETIAPTTLPYRGTTVCPFPFDVSVWETFSALCFGGELHVLQPELFSDAQRYVEYMNANHITNAYIPPALLEGVAREYKMQGRPLDLNRLMIGVESIKQGTLQKFRDLSPDLRIVEPYGPTEATIGATMFNFEAAKFPELRTPIGRPIDNGYKIYIVDSLLRPVPTGVTGEILIGGSGLGRGYINRPASTAEKFIPDPFSHEPGARVYRTGDAGRILWDGNLEFAGRVDFQLKVRGFRIEPGEIETALEQHENVKDALVIAREDRPGDKRIVGYVVLGNGHPLASGDLHEYLEGKLPDYMIPTAFVVMDQIPVTANGKPDRKNLPAPEGSREERSDEYIPPRDESELLLAQIWEEALNIYPIGVRDNFFSLGGHSMLAVLVLSEVQKKFGKDLPLTTLFNSSTIEGMAQVIREQGSNGSWSPLVPIRTEGHLKPFFCVHGVGGDVINLYHLGHHLGQDRPFYGLQSKGLYGETQPNQTIPDMAALYLDAVKTVQPQGPYLIGGYSFGARVAFRMAEQLREQGETVELMAVIDYASPTNGTGIMGLDWDDAGWLAYTLNLMGRMYEEVDVSYELLKSLDEEKKWDYIRERLIKANLLPPGISKTRVHGMINVLKSNIHSHYSAGSETVSPGRITLLRADKFPIETPNTTELTGDPTWGWKRLSTEPVDVHILPGDHKSILEEPHVRTLANRLRQCIQDAESVTAEQNKNGLEVNAATLDEQLTNRI